MSVETDEFAALLHELKERSGRSYGALAARLHVSTSTLHRYCNGAAVPTEYAPVERFARVCGAGADELVELHRRWILADAARRREPAAAAPVPPPAPAPLPEPAPAPGPLPTVASGPAGDVRRPRRRPRTPVLLIVTAVAVAAAVVIPAVALNGRADTPRASPPSPAALATTPPAAAAAAAPGPAATPSTAPPAAPPAPTTASAPPRTEDDPPPFQVNVMTDNWGSACGQWFLSPQPPRAVAAPPENAQTDSWAAAQHAVPGGHLRLQVTAQGADAKPVVLHSLYVHVVSTKPAPKWNAYMMGSGCGGAITPAAFTVDLDAAAPRPVPVPAMEGNTRGRSSAFPYTVSATDPQVLNVDAGTVSQDVSWYLSVAWSSGDLHGNLKIDDHGRPFRTAGLKGAPAYFYQDDRAGWAPTTPDA
ncbi:helix-turn-helix domain-containing protein [Kitasatospora sp. NBC_01560]|uniref:helix-turn-helix domain-containing protein n=1 Tax=Kitasatospora sp. NBC_01560 TaxID=2975965 RepID=UPI003868A165